MVASLGTIFPANRLDVESSRARLSPAPARLRRLVCSSGNECASAADAPVAALREKLVPLCACQLAVGESAGVGFPGGGVEVPDDAAPVGEHGNGAFPVGEG